MCEPSDIPILFSDRMHIETLAKRKRVTRRVVTSHTSVPGAYSWNHPELKHDFDSAWVDPGFTGEDGKRRDAYLKTPMIPREGQQDLWGDVTDRVYCRIKSGDQLWVREAHALLDMCLWPDVTNKWIDHKEKHVCVFYRVGFTKPGPPKWRPSIHMPRVAARTFLVVESVKPERLQEITWKGILAEGVREGGCPHSALEAFRKLWDGLNAGRGYPWGDNPWVWVIGFRLDTKR